MNLCKCKKCGHEQFQEVIPFKKCQKCGSFVDTERDIVRKLSLEEYVKMRQDILREEDPDGCYPDPMEEEE